MEQRTARLQAEGAEFLVLGRLLIEGISAWKGYTNFPGYDIIAQGSTGARSCRIQVKSTTISHSTEFDLANFDCDFICYVALNRRTRGSKLEDSGPREPEIYVFPKEVALAAWQEGSRSKVRLSAIKTATPTETHGTRYRSTSNQSRCLRLDWLSGFRVDTGHTSASGDLRDDAAGRRRRPSRPKIATN